MDLSPFLTASNLVSSTSTHCWHLPTSPHSQCLSPSPGSLHLLPGDFIVVGSCLIPSPLLLPSLNASCSQRDCSEAHRDLQLPAASTLQWLLSSNRIFLTRVALADLTTCFVLLPALYTLVIPNCLNRAVPSAWTVLHTLFPGKVLPTLQNSAL